MVLLLLKRTISFLVLLFVFASNINSLSIFEVVERVVNNSPELRVIFEKKNQSIQDYVDARSAYLPKIYVLFNREYSKSDPITSSAQSAWTSVNKFQLMAEQKLFDMEQASKLLKYSQLIQSSEFENQKLLESIY